MPKMRVTNKDVNINEQGYLIRLEDWSEEYVKKSRLYLSESDLSIDLL